MVTMWQHTLEATAVWGMCVWLVTAMMIWSTKFVSILYKRANQGTIFIQSMKML